MRTKLVKPDKEVSVDGKELAGELHQLLMMSIGYRGDCGATLDIQNAYMRGQLNEMPNSMPEYQILPDNDFQPYKPDKPCDCKEGETCDLCDPSLANICTTDDIAARMKKLSPFSRLARMISTIKSYDYISLAEHAYANVGNKPFKLKSNKDIIVTPEEMEELAKLITAQIEAYIIENDVRVTEIPYAFNFDAMSDMVDSFEQYMVEKAKKKNQDDLQHYEDAVERTFNRTNFMTQYLEAIKDTANYPLGVLWIDDSAVRKEKVVTKSGKVKIERRIQAVAERVHPAHIWFTPDFSFSEVGRAVFRVKRFSRGDIARWREMNVAGSDKLNRNITKFLEDYSEGCFIPYIMLFRNLNPIINYDYDVIISRGLFSREKVEGIGVEIPEGLKYENFIPCEIYWAGSYILRVRVLDVLDKHLGVFTTVFRRNCDSIYGYSVHDFCYPFANLYMNVIDSMDRSVGRATGMIIQLDRSVIDDPEKYFVRDKHGFIDFDLTKDQFVEFDSTQAFGAPNFKGFPITITEIPSNLDKLMPMLELVINEMERITKIPNMLTDGTDINSALRTTSNMNTAFAASGKVVQALLRESENRILKPAISYIFDCELLAGRIPKGLLDLEPEILLSDTLVRETNDGQEIVQNLAILAQYRDIIPPDKFSSLLNTISRDVFGFREDLIPDAGVFTMERNPQQQSVV